MGYTGRNFTEQDARLFVKGYFELDEGTLEDGTIGIGQITDCAIEAWKTFTDSSVEEMENYNDLEQLRWVYTVLHELVGDPNRVPKTLWRD